MSCERITLAHGSGGKLSQRLIEQVMIPPVANNILAELGDSAKLNVDGSKLAFTTDSFVVKPLFFAGGDIGKLAVCGTVNDLAVAGAVPLYLSAGFIIEEGFLIADLEKIVKSMAQAAQEAGIKIVTGDTKVVEKGAADGLYINTAGIGVLMAGVNISPYCVRPGDDVIINGNIGQHALAVMCERHGLTLPEAAASDCAPLNGLIKDMLAAVPSIGMLRDATRGGLAAVLNEIAVQAKVGIMLDEASIPVGPEVQSACDLLGFDPLYLANEGKIVAFVEKKYSERLLAAMHAHPYGCHAKIIGTVVDKPAARVVVRTNIGGLRLVEMPAGDQLPRIC